MTEKTPYDIARSFPSKYTGPVLTLDYDVFDEGVREGYLKVLSMKELKYTHEIITGGKWTEAYYLFCEDIVIIKLLE